MILCFSSNSFGAPFLSILTARWCFGLGNNQSIARWIVDQVFEKPSPTLKLHRQGRHWVIMVPR